MWFNHSFTTIGIVENIDCHIVLAKIPDEPDFFIGYTFIILKR